MDYAKPGQFLPLASPYKVRVIWDFYTSWNNSFCRTGMVVVLCSEQGQGETHARTETCQVILEPGGEGDWSHLNNRFWLRLPVHLFF